MALTVQYSIPRIPLCECGNPTTNTGAGCFRCRGIQRDLKQYSHVEDSLRVKPKQEYVPLIRSGRDDVGTSSVFVYGLE